MLVEVVVVSTSDDTRRVIAHTIVVLLLHLRMMWYRRMVVEVIVAQMVRMRDYTVTAVVCRNVTTLIVLFTGWEFRIDDVRRRPTVHQERTHSCSRAHRRGVLCPFGTGPTIEQTKYQTKNIKY